MGITMIYISSLESMFEISIANEETKEKWYEFLIFIQPSNSVCVNSGFKRVNALKKSDFVHNSFLKDSSLVWVPLAQY